MSGGIDSAVVSTICATTGMKLLLFQCPLNKLKSRRLKQAHCDWLQKSFANVNVININLDSVFNAFEKASGSHNSEHAFCE